MAGVRTAANVKLFADGVLLHQDTGEVQLTDYGISGIPVFQVSRFAAKALAAGKEVCAYLDFFPTADETALTRILKNRFYQSGIGKSAKEALVGLFADKLSRCFLKTQSDRMGYAGRTCYGCAVSGVKPKDPAV